MAGSGHPGAQGQPASRRPVPTFSCSFSISSLCASSDSSSTLRCAVSFFRNSISLRGDGAWARGTGVGICAPSLGQGGGEEDVGVMGVGDKRCPPGGGFCSGFVCREKGGPGWVWCPEEEPMPGGCSMSRGWVVRAQRMVRAQGVVHAQGMLHAPRMVHAQVVVHAQE